MILKRKVAVIIAFCGVLTAVGGCSSSIGPLSEVDAGSTSCLPGDMDQNDEVAMPIGIYGLPKEADIQITGIEPVNPVNLVVHADDYRVIGEIVNGDHHLMAGRGEYPPIKPFRALWEAAASPFDRRLTADDLPVSVIAHITPSSDADASLDGFDISYTNAGKNYTVRTTAALLVPNGSCIDPT